MNTELTSKTIFTLVLYFTVVFDHYLESSFFYCMQIKIFFFQLTDPFDNIIFIYYYYYYYYHYCYYYEAYNIQKQSWRTTASKYQDFERLKEFIDGF